MRKLDGKFDIAVENGEIKIVNRFSGEPIPYDEPLFLLRARDAKAYQTLQAYHLLCSESPEIPLAHRELLYKRMLLFSRFILEHPERIKLPGISMRDDNDPSSTGKGMV